VSLSFRDPRQQRALEPWVAAPARRLRVIERLAAAGIPVGVMLAPIIPGLNDDAIAWVLERAHAAGATTAGYVLLRLPGAVKQVFEERLRAELPLQADKVLGRLRQTRGGELYDARFGVRGRGEGAYADVIRTVFDTTVRRLGLNARDRAAERDADAPTTFVRPLARGTQLALW